MAGSPSPTQPGRGIRKVIDLYHDLSDLIDRAKKHAAMLEVGQEGMEDIDERDFQGFEKEDIDKERME